MLFLHAVFCCRGRDRTTIENIQFSRKLERGWGGGSSVSSPSHHVGRNISALWHSVVIHVAALVVVEAVTVGGMSGSGSNGVKVTSEVKLSYTAPMLAIYRVKTRRLFYN